MTHSTKLTIVFTGGTISMTHDADDGSALPTLNGADICASVPELSHFTLTNFDFGQFPGPHMTWPRLFALTRQVRAAFTAGAEGVVITHGTDTIEETAFFLDALHNETRPIVLVGAMRTRDELSWDGPINLFSGCLVAGDAAARGRGVMVVMNNTINAASEVTKTYTEAIDTFVSPDTGPLGIVDIRKVIFYRAPVHRSLIDPIDVSATHEPPRVELLEATTGSDGLLVDAAVAGGCRGLVIAAMGRGNVPVLMAEAIERAIRKNVQVVVCSRCWGGRVAPVYGYAGGGARLKAAGAVFAPWLNGPKARIALSLALAAGYDSAQLHALFDWS